MKIVQISYEKRTLLDLEYFLLSMCLTCVYRPVLIQLVTVVLFYHMCSRSKISFLRPITTKTQDSNMEFKTNIFMIKESPHGQMCKIWQPGSCRAMNFKVGGPERQGVCEPPEVPERSGVWGDLTCIKWHTKFNHTESIIYNLCIFNSLHVEYLN